MWWSEYWLLPGWFYLNSNIYVMWILVVASWLVEVGDPPIWNTPQKPWFSRRFTQIWDHKVVKYQWDGNVHSNPITSHDMGMDQYLLIPFLVGWTSIYQLFWCSPGVLLVLTHCHIPLKHHSNPVKWPLNHHKYHGGMMIIQEEEDFWEHYEQREFDSCLDDGD